MESKTLQLHAEHTKICRYCALCSANIHIYVQILLLPQCFFRYDVYPFLKKKRSFSSCTQGSCNRYDAFWRRRHMETSWMNVSFAVHVSVCGNVPSSMLSMRSFLIHILFNFRQIIAKLPKNTWQCLLKTKTPNMQRKWDKCCKM